MTTRGDYLTCCQNIKQIGALHHFQNHGKPGAKYIQNKLWVSNSKVSLYKCNLWNDLWVMIVPDVHLISIEYFRMKRESYLQSTAVSKIWSDWILWHYTYSVVKLKFKVMAVVKKVYPILYIHNVNNFNTSWIMLRWLSQNCSNASRAKLLHG